MPSLVIEYRIPAFRRIYMYPGKNERNENEVGSVNEFFRFPLG